MYPMYSEEFFLANKHYLTLLPGVRQFHDGRLYREARMNNNRGSIMIHYISTL